MSVPDFQTMMRPVLVMLADDHDHTVVQHAERLDSTPKVRQ